MIESKYVAEKDDLTVSVIARGTKGVAILFVKHDIQYQADRWLRFLAKIYSLSQSMRTDHLSVLPTPCHAERKMQERLSQMISYSKIGEGTDYGVLCPAQGQQVQIQSSASLASYSSSINSLRCQKSANRLAIAPTSGIHRISIGRHHSLNGVTYTLHSRSSAEAERRDDQTGPHGAENAMGTFVQQLISLADAHLSA